MRPHTQGLVAINLAAIIFGTAALYGKLPLAPVWIVAMRAVFASATLFLLTRLRPTTRGITRAGLWPLIATGFSLCVHWVTFFLSVQEAGVAIATLTFACYPFFTVLWETLRERRRPTIVEIAASTAIILAVSLLVDFEHGGAVALSGTLIGLFSAFAFAWFGMACKELTGKLSSVWVSLAQNTVVALLLLPILPFAGHPPQEPMQWFWLLMLGVFNTTLMHQLYLYALQRLSASTCSAFVALEPVYAILFAAMLFGETVRPIVILSGLLILGGALALLRREKTPA